MTQQSINVASLTLPKGGGALRGMGETFQPNAFTGTASVSIPIPTSPCRGFEPKLSLEYSSGSGNGIFGIGFNLAIPNISRKTEKGFPKYDDTDTFLISNADDLVPKLVKQNGKWVPDTTEGRAKEGSEETFTITRYRPRTEGLFARIEKWVNTADGDIHWRVTTKENITSVYGYRKDANSRIADPDDGTRVYQWLLEETYDAKGNRIKYEYRPENLQLRQNQSGGNDPAPGANRYIHKIKYGSYLNKGQEEQWHFELIFDYGERPLDQPDQITYQTNGTWEHREDPFSSYRAGFEIRTERLCRGILMFHRFGDADPFLVHGTHLHYEETPCLSLLTRVTQVGYRQEGDACLSKAMPPLDLTYSKPSPVPGFQPLAGSATNGHNGALHQRIDELVDLYGEGMPGILHSDDQTTLYSRPQGNAQYAPPRVPAHFPIDRNLESGQYALLDLGGDGKLDLVVQAPSGSGYFQSNPDGTWDAYRAFSTYPTDVFSDGRQMVDVTGDGLADLVLFGSDAVKVYPSLGKRGFAPASVRLRERDLPLTRQGSAVEVVRFADMFGDGGNHLVRIRSGQVECWPNLGYGRFGEKVTFENAPLFGGRLDPSRLFLTDLDGSGTADLVYVCHDRLEIYSNQSGNAFAEREILPLPHGYDNLDHIRFADVLGNGTSCLILTSRQTDLGLRHEYHDFNGGVKPHLLVGMNNNMGAEKKFHYAPSTQFYLADLKAGRPWATRLSFPVHVIERVEVIDHIAGSRLVTRYAYHDGYYDPIEREFRGFGYVERWDTESFDDHKKRIAGRQQNGTSDVAVGVDEDPTSYVAPVYTRSWFHTGASVNAARLSNHYQGHYYDGDPDSGHLPDSVLDDATFNGAQPDTMGEAYRALHGHKLREEIYAWDHDNRDDPAGDPYAVTESNFKIRLLQPMAGQKHAVCFVHPSEEISWHYERNPADPRNSHALTLEVDEFGNVLKEAAIGYGRRTAITDPELTADDKTNQSRLLITYTENIFTNAVLTADAYHTPLPAEMRTFELTGFTPENNAERFSFDEWTRNGFALLSNAQEIPYEQTADNRTREKRLVEHVRTLYRPDDLGASQQNDPLALLGLGELQPLALPGESYKLAFTPGLLDQIYIRNGQKLLSAHPADVLAGGGADRGGYVDLDSDGHWWIPAGRVFLSPNSDDDAAQELKYARSHFFLPHRSRDPFHTDAVSTESFVTYDAYDLLILETRDALDNVVKTEHDYHLLKPRLITDPNGNRTAAAFDALGMVVATAVMGKEGENLGDLLEDFDADLPLAELQAFVADPQARAASLLGKATTRFIYDLDRYQRAGQPPFASTLARETHFYDPGGARTKIQISFSYSDGFGREIQNKIQAEPGQAPERQPDVKLKTDDKLKKYDIRPGALAFDVDGKLALKESSQRWVGTGRAVFNNKGKPMRQYEPFFSATHLYEDEREMTDAGVSSILFYDPVERVVATLHPNHTFEKVVFDPWRQETWDVNDTVLVTDPRNDPDVGKFFQLLPGADYLPTWYDQRCNGQRGAAEKAAALKAAAHTATPTVTYFDTLGRPMLTIADNGKDANGADQKHATRVIRDIEGNDRKLIDANGRIAMRYAYDMLGNRIHEASMDAGERWMLHDALGKPLYAWDSRGHTFRTEYDPLRRPLRSFVTGADTTKSKQELLTERLVYGEQHPEAERLNLRGKLYLHLDQAGVVASEEDDFKGNLLRASRRIATDYKQTLDWSEVDAVIQITAEVPLDRTALGAALTPLLETEIYTSRTRYDALNRPVQIITPRSDQPNAKVNVIQYGYNQANLLERVDVWLDHKSELTGRLDANEVAPAPKVGVKNIDFNAKGQRLQVEYKNGATTRYAYDPETFRLIHLYTRRGAAFTKDCGGDPPPARVAAPDTPPQNTPCGLQNLHYTYDPVGNITQIRDDAQQTVYFAGQVVLPHAAYRYDALYRLIEARGREHVGQAGVPQATWKDTPRFVAGIPHPNQPQAMRTYTETYQYDPSGNIHKVAHRATNGNWTRDHTCDKTSNRLSTTSVGGATEASYAYDDHGNITSMPHLSHMQWDYRDQLQATARQVVNNGGTPEKTWYVYDASGQRVRKVTESYAANGKTPVRRKERLYLGGFEIYREYESDGDVISLERQTLHVMDDHKRIALVETKTRENGVEIATPKPLTRYQFGNHLGSASLELNAAGEIISYEEYYPYGGTSYQAVNSQIQVSPKRYRYSGKERDDSTGLYYYGARYYAPWLGRWMSPDPAGTVDGLNLYAFVRGNPIGLIDRWGFNGVKLKAQEVIEQGKRVLRRAKEVKHDLLQKVEGLSDLTKSPPENFTGKIRDAISVSAHNARLESQAIDHGGGTSGGVLAQAATKVASAPVAGRFIASVAHASIAFQAHQAMGAASATARDHRESEAQRITPQRSDSPRRGARIGTGFAEDARALRYHAERNAQASNAAATVLPAGKTFRAGYRGVLAVVRSQTGAGGLAETSRGMLAGVEAHRQDQEMRAAQSQESLTPHPPDSSGVRLPPIGGPRVRRLLPSNQYGAAQQRPRN